MRYYILTPLLMLVFSLSLTISYAEEEVPAEDPMLAGVIKQIDDSIAEFNKLYKIKIKYEVEPRTIHTLNDMFGFCARFKSTIQDGSRVNWPEKIKSLSSFSLFVRINAEKETFSVLEEDANALIEYNRRDIRYADLLDTLCSEKEQYIKYSDYLKKQKLSVKMGTGMSWGRAAIFLRMLEEFLKTDKKSAKTIKDFTVILEVEEEKKPDYANKTIFMPFRTDKERLAARLEEHRLEYDAYEKCVNHEEALKKVNVTIQYDEVFGKFLPTTFYRTLRTILSKCETISRTPASAMKMSRKPIMITDKFTGEKDDAYYISIHAIDGIDAMFK